MLGQDFGKNETMHVDPIEEALFDIHNELQDKFGANDHVSRALAKDHIVAKMEDLLKNHKISSYVCVCDETNNTITHIDNGEIYVVLLVQRIRTVSYERARLFLQTANEISWAWKRFWECKSVCRS